MAEIKKSGISFLKAGKMAAVLFSCIAVIVLLSAAGSERDKSVCSAINVSIDHHTGNYFIERQEVDFLVRNEKDSLIGQSLNTIDVARIEQKIKSGAHVKNAEVYVDIQGVLNIEVTQRVPVLRVFNRHGVSYYIDENGDKMPLSLKFTSKVPVATGHIDDNEGTGKNNVLYSLHLLANYIKKDEFWSAQVVQVYVNEAQEFEIIPRLGNHTILLGDITNLEEKFNKLMLFYNQGLKHVGWYSYKEISLKYKDQIVCTKH